MRKRSRSNLKIAVISVVLIFVTIISVLQLTGIVDFFGLFADDWSTGLDIDTDTQEFAYWGDPNHESDGQQFFYTYPDDELLDDTRYVVSWQPSGYSVKIVTMGGHFWYHPRGTNMGISGGPHPSIRLGRYWWMVEYMDVEGNTHLVIDGENSWIDTNRVHITAGNIGPAQIPNFGYDPAFSGSHFPPGIWSGNWNQEYAHQYPNEWLELLTSGLSFQMKGNLVGAVRVYCVLQTVERMSGCGGFCWEHPERDIVVAEDWAYLPSGEGEITIESTHAIDTGGTETAPETGIVYTKYVYEEGCEVEISVDAGYSGVSLDPGDEEYGKGWAVEIYDSGGLSRYITFIPDNVRGYPVRYTIPAGAFIPNDPNDNEWRVVLKNTLFDQSETRLFVVDRFEYMPGQTLIQTNKDRYVQYETVTVTLTAYANEQTGSPIDHFTAWATWGSPTSTEYASTVHDYPAQNVGGQLYRAIFTFDVSERGDTNVYIRAHAIDSEARAGAEGEKTVWTEAAVGNYQVRVTVLDVDDLKPIQGATVTMGDRTVTSGPSGVANVYINFGTYVLTASKPGYGDYQQAGVVVQSDMDITVSLSKVTGPAFDVGLILIIIIVLVAVIGVSLFLYYAKKRGWLERLKRKGKKK